MFFRYEGQIDWSLFDRTTSIETPAGLVEEEHNNRSLEEECIIMLCVAQPILVPVCI